MRHSGWCVNHVDVDSGAVLRRDLARGGGGRARGRPGGPPGGRAAMLSSEPGIPKIGALRRGRKFSSWVGRTSSQRSSALSWRSRRHTTLRADSLGSGLPCAPASLVCFGKRSLCLRRRRRCVELRGRDPTRCDDRVRESGTSTADASSGLAGQQTPRPRRWLRLRRRHHRRARQVVGGHGHARLRPATTRRLQGQD